MLLEATESTLGQHERHWETVKAPSEDHRSLLVPNLDTWINEITGELTARRSASSESTGKQKWIEDLRSLARHEIAAAALEYVQSYIPEFYSDVGFEPNPVLLGDYCWVVGGHQPEAFHPGVWFKNFFMDSVVNGLSRDGKHSLGLHVIVDHDLAKSTAIRVPCFEQVQGTGEEFISRFRFENLRLPLKLDEGLSQVKPWHFHVVDRRNLLQFAATVETCMHSIGIEEPLAKSFCNYLQMSSTSLNAALAFSQARHRLEFGAGVRNLEVPMGAVCETRAWSLFAAHCIANAEQLHEQYNRCLSSYRQDYQVKNLGQPVPPLLKNQDWIELPFWLYRQTDATRNRLWVREIAGGFELGSGGNASELLWTVRADGPLESLAESIRGWVQEGVCLRPRALITTMFLRMFVADGFVHGIGGGLYDRLTDRLIHSFWECSAPTYAIATATFRLPFNEERSKAFQTLEVHRDFLIQQIHDMRSRPELFLDLDRADHQRLLEEHQVLLSEIPPRGKKRHWHLQMHNLRTRIRSELAAVSQRLADQLQEFQRDIQQQTFLRSREFSFLLFPASQCVHQLRRLAQERG